jgi:hypothetical protein
MHKSKMVPMALGMLALGAASAFAEVKINDNLSTSGFVDMSINGFLPDTGDNVLNMGLDQYELDFMYKFGNVSARADINALPSTPSVPGTPVAGTTVFLEQGFVSYAMGAAALSAGRFLSSSGFEAAEPTGLYQYSTSKTLVYGYYQNGLNLSYSAAKFGLYGAVVSDLWNPQEFDLKTPGFEGQVSLMPVGGVTVKATFLHQIYDKDAPATLGDESQSLFNIWAQYAVGKITTAAEYNQLISWKTAAGDDLSGMGWLVMGNYKVTDRAAVTARYSALTIDDKNSATDDMDSEVTLSPSFAVTGNWLALAEIKYEIDMKKTDYAVESTFSF